MPPLEEQKTEQAETKESSEGILDKQEEAAATKEETKVAAEPEPEEGAGEKEENQHYLLDRLFKFVRTEEKPLNPVLSGYFNKLVSLLITREQKKIVPYVFRDHPDLIDCLLHHVYQKSISELLNKFLAITDPDLDQELQ